MKTLNKVLAIALAAFAAASCMDKPSYNVVPYVCFPNGSLTVAEDAGKVEIPVQAFNTVNPVTVNVAVSGTAEKGVNYNITGDGTITLEPGVAKKIVVDVIDIAGVYTGDKTVVLTLSTSQEGLDLGALKSMRLTIEDKDFNYNWKWLEGKWTVKNDKIMDNKPYEVEFKKTGDNTFTLKGLADEAVEIEGTVDFAKKQAKIPYAPCGSWDGYDWYYVGVVNGGPSTTLVLNFTPNEITLDYSLYEFDEGYWYGASSVKITR